MGTGHEEMPAPQVGGALNAVSGQPGCSQGSAREPSDLIRIGDVAITPFSGEALQRHACPQLPPCCLRLTSSLCWPCSQLGLQESKLERAMRRLPQPVLLSSGRLRCSAWPDRGVSAPRSYLGAAPWRSRQHGADACRELRGSYVVAACRTLYGRCIFSTRTAASTALADELYAATRTAQFAANALALQGHFNSSILPFETDYFGATTAGAQAPGTTVPSLLWQVLFGCLQGGQCSLVLGCR